MIRIASRLRARFFRLTGTGPGLVINGNLIIGNAADSGSGGGLRFQHVNGTDVLDFPNGTQCDATLTNSTCHWNTVRVTNNIIANNVAGWDGGGVSLQDSLAVNLVNNTIVSNDSTASSGVLFGSLFAPLASARESIAIAGQYEVMSAGRWSGERHERRHPASQPAGVGLQLPGESRSG